MPQIFLEIKKILSSTPQADPRPLDAVENSAKKKEKTVNGPGSWCFFQIVRFLVYIRINTI